MMVQCDVNDLLRIIGMKEVLIFQLRLENLRLQRELNELKQAQAQSCDKACQHCQGCQQEKGSDETKKS